MDDCPSRESASAVASSAASESARPASSCRDSTVADPSWASQSPLASGASRDAKREVVLEVATVEA